MCFVHRQACEFRGERMNSVALWSFCDEKRVSLAWVMLLLVWAAACFRRLGFGTCTFYRYSHVFTHSHAVLLFVFGLQMLVLASRASA